MSSLSRELVFLILQFLDEEKFKETVHKLEQESGFFFNMKHFEDQVQAGEWDEVERYLCGFTKVEDNRYSMKIFFEIRKQKYLEALDRQDRSKAVEILVKDLKVFASFNEELFKEITQLLTLDNFRQNEQLSKYGDTKSARNIMLVELKKLIEANPLFRDKLAFPAFKSSRLRTLINQSLNWQHQLCKNPRPNPDIKTLFTDHSCTPTTANGARPPPTNGPIVGPIPKAGAFPPIGAHGPFQPVVSPSPGAIAGWMSSNNPSLAHPGVASGPPGLVQPSSAAAFLKHPRTPTGMTGIDYQSADSEHLMKRMRTGQSDEVSFSGVAHTPNVYSQDDLPKTVVRSLNQGSNVMSMDFHPQQQTILLVGTNVGDISLWEVGSREKLAHKPFKVWDLSTSSMPLQTALLNDAAISVNRCVWGPDGLMLGVAFSKHIVQIYTYNPSGELRQHLEIDAHIGGVNDIAFAHPNKQLCIVTCGDDKMIKVWDAVAGRRQYTFEGHEAPVYSVCPHYKESIQFIFSTAIDGKIKAWLYDSLGSRVDYDAPGLWCTMMAYSADGTRLFSCGTSKEGESHLVEWNESEGTINRTFSGFRKRSSGVVQFDTTRSRFLAAGDEFQIKFWDMDNTNMLTAVDAEGGLPASPRLRFNKEGSLLAATTSDNGIKILANNDGIRLIRMLENRAIDKNRSPSEPINSKPLTLGPMGNVPSGAAPAMERSDRIPPAVSIGSLGTMDNNRHVDVKPRILDELDKSKSWSSPDIVDSSQLKALRLPDPMATGKVIDSIAVESSAKKKMGRKRKKSERASIHPKNKYADKAPDFGLLASLYASFKPFVFYSSDGRPKIDWTDFNSTRELTRVLLLHDHGLNWWIPDGQLCPTVPNRSNYIHWIEDLLSSNVIPEKKGNGKIVRGFDIGTGANCIYPLLGASLLGWSFVGSDVTDVALEWAERNVKNNPHISELIEVRKVVNRQGALSIEDVHNAQSVNGESKTNVNECLIMEQLDSSNKYDGPPVLSGVVKDGEKFDFCMCNPPFFENMDEAGLNPKTACGGTPEEMVCPGGEKAFITRIIEDSAVSKESFRWYTSMVGRKANLKFLTSKLREVGVTIVKTTEFVQGRTCRWGLAWSFLPPIKKITSPHVAAKSIISFMLEGMQRQHSAIDVLKSVEFYFSSMGASSKLNASSFVVDITLSNEQCDAFLKNQEKHYDEPTNCNSVEGNFASSSCSHLPPSDIMCFRISVFQQIPGTLLVKGSLQQRDSTVAGLMQIFIILCNFFLPRVIVIVSPISCMFPSVIQLLEETLTLKFCKVKNV